MWGNIMNEKCKYILTKLEENFTVDAVLKENDDSRIVSYESKNDDTKIVLISSKNTNENVLQRVVTDRCDNFPKIFDYCNNDDETFILEEYIAGCRLDEVLKLKNISKKQASKYGIDICKALEFLHSKKIIHRDVKPTNIIITPNDNAVLVDIQSTRIISEDRDTDTKTIGTIGYAAPEQYGIIQSTPQTDIYALGVTLNEMVTNQHPSVASCKGRLGKIIEKCTHTQISKRYKTVEDLRKDLTCYYKFH